MEHVFTIISGLYFTCLAVWIVGSMLYEHCVKQTQNIPKEEHK